MHEGGECDVRAVYCAMSIASLLGILDQRLAENVHVFIKNCQQFEGGFAGFPDTEAHGGYAFVPWPHYVLPILFMKSKITLIYPVSFDGFQCASTILKVDFREELTSWLTLAIVIGLEDAGHC